LAQVTPIGSSTIADRTNLKWIWNGFSLQYSQPEMGTVFRGALLGFLMLTTTWADEERPSESQVNKALIVSPTVRDIIEQKPDAQVYKEMALATVRTTAVGGGGCAVGALVGSILFPGLGTTVGCAGGAFFAGIFQLAREISANWSDQMRRAIYAWKVYRRSHKHLKMTPGADVKKKFRACAKECHEDLWPKGVDNEEANFLKELYAECTFAGQYITRFVEKYGVVKFGDQIAFFQTFAGYWKNLFMGSGKIMDDAEIDEYLSKHKNDKDEL